MFEILPLAVVLLTGSEIWQDLLFGPGAFLGAGIFMAIAFLVTVKVKYAGIVFIPMCFFLGYEYLSTIEGNSIHMWCGVLMGITSVVLLLIMLRSKN